MAAAAEEAARALSVAASAPASSSSSSSSSSSPHPLGLNLALVIDLRSANEWEAGNGAEVLRALEALSGKKKRSESGDGNYKCAAGNGDGSETTPLRQLIPRVERVALQEWTRFTHAFVARLPATRSLGAAAHFLLFKSLGFGPPIPGMHERLCVEADRGGLHAMNTTVLAAFPLEIARVLRLITSATAGSASASAPASAPPPPSSPPLRRRLRRPSAAVFAAPPPPSSSSPSPSSSPASASAMVACKLGKDRTGIVSALCLAVAGASRREVAADYARSASGLAGRPPPATAPSLGGAPRAAMERALDWLSEHFARFADEREVEGYREREERRCRGRRGEEEQRCRGRRGEEGEGDPRWRAGVLGYLDREARFLADEREALRRALTE